MSLISRLFGPQTVKEYAEAVKKRGESKVDVIIAAYDYFREGLDMGFYNTFVRLVSEGVKSDLYTDVCVRSKNSYGSIRSVYQVDKRTVNMAFEYAAKLKEMGLDVTVSGRPVNEVKTMFDDYTKKIDMLPNDGSMISPENAIAIRKSMDKGKFIKSVVNGNVFEYDGMTYDTLKEKEIEYILDEKLRQSEETHIVGLKY